LREVALQERGQAVADAAAVIDEPAAVLDEVLQGAGLLVIRQPRLELVAVQGEQVSQVGGVAGIILGPARRERLTELGRRLRVDRAESEEVVLEQCVDERAARLLQANGDLPARVTPTQRVSPLVELSRRVPDDGSLAPARGTIDFMLSAKRGVKGTRRPSALRYHLHNATREPVRGSRIGVMSFATFPDTKNICYGIVSAVI
jgi:hypothetical protein